MHSHANIISDTFFWVHYILYIFLCILYTFSGLLYTIFWCIVYIFPDPLYPSFMVHLNHTFYQYFWTPFIYFSVHIFSESVYIFFWCILYIYILCYIHISHYLLSFVLVQFIHFLGAFNTFFLAQLTNILEHSFRYIFPDAFFLTHFINIFWCFTCLYIFLRTHFI